MQDEPDHSGIHISLKREDPKLQTPTTKDLKLITRKNCSETHRAEGMHLTLNEPET
jgi:hypothetical protein